MKKKFRYYLPEGDLGINYEDEGPWRNYECSGCNTDSLALAVDEVVISEVDQDGGELNCYGFWDAPVRVQNRILRLLGVSMNQAVASLEEYND